MSNDNFFPTTSPEVVEARAAGTTVTQQWWEVGCMAHAHHVEKVLLHEEDIKALLAEGKLEGARSALRAMEARMRRLHQVYRDLKHLGQGRLEFPRLVENPQKRAQRALLRAREGVLQAKARAAALAHFGLH